MALTNTYRGRRRAAGERAAKVACLLTTVFFFFFFVASFTPRSVCEKLSIEFVPFFCFSFRFRKLTISVFAAEVFHAFSALDIIYRGKTDKRMRRNRNRKITK